MRDITYSIACLPQAKSVIRFKSSVGYIHRHMNYIIKYDVREYTLSYVLVNSFYTVL